MDYLEQLNPQQKVAATHKDGPLLILAGAGSGKTSTMTCRIAWLVKEQGVSPYNIFAVTFTNKAAGEMRERVEALVGDTSGMWILTFHSACLRMLRRFADRIGFNKDFVIYDPSDQKVVVKNSLKARNIDDKKYSPNYLLSIISSCKEKGQTAEEYAGIYGEDFKYKAVSQVYTDYENTLRKNNAMDFDDLLGNAVKLLEQEPDVLDLYQERFRYIMVDEYQDTNMIQYRLIRLLAKKYNNICVVGDDDQCIYQWRGADIRNILEFEKDFKGVKVVKLEQNYRSYGNILEAAHSVIAQNKGRKDKKLWTDKDAGSKLKYYRGDDDRDEGRYIAREISRLHDGGRQYNDFAVLYRTNAQSRKFEEAFAGESIPYRVLGGVRYYDRKEVKDITAYMRLVQNPDDDLALERAINEPKRGIGAKTMEKLRVLASVRGESVFRSLCDPEILEGLSAKAEQSLKALVELIQNLSAEQENLRVSDIYDRLLAGSGYIDALKEQNTVEAEGRIENLLEFRSVILEYEQDKDPKDTSLAEFMEKIVLMADVDNHDPGEDAVVLMTLHSAKGLEFPVVFMAGMEDGLFPGWRAFEKPDGLEEERRLCYVGMTRAREILYLTAARMRTLYGQTDFTRESTFLRELDMRLVDGDAVYQGKTYDKYSGYTADGRAGSDVKIREYEKKTAFRPFETASRAVKRAAAKETLAGADLAAGDKVSHAKFGEGMVIECDGKTVTVAFDSSGVKKLALSVAPLKKL